MSSLTQEQIKKCKEALTNLCPFFQDHPTKWGKDKYNALQVALSLIDEWEKLTAITLRQKIKIAGLEEANKNANTMIGANCDELQEIIQKKEVELKKLREELEVYIANRTAIHTRIMERK